MVCTANDLLEWKDFPKGLKILLLDEDRDFAFNMKSKLEEMEYNVSVFFNEIEATLASKSENFHVAIVEVCANNCDGRFKFLQTAKDLPTIMMSDMHCLQTMMKCIALGAVEFLQKPVSEDKLKNIWQHVVHKAYNAGVTMDTDSKDPVMSKLQLKKECTMVEEKFSSEEQVHVQECTVEENLRAKELVHVHTEAHDQTESDHDQSTGSDKFPAPSTPQLKQQGGRFTDGKDYQEQTNSSADKEAGEHDGESKSVDTTYNNRTCLPQSSEGTVVGKEEDGNSDHDSRGVISNSCIHPTDKEGPVGDANDCGAAMPGKEPFNKGSSGAKASRKKSKVDWTPHLHKKFVQAVEKLGIDQAIPSRILELMKVEGLTRHNVASHLQKYRMQRRHILPKEEERKWPNPRDTMHRNAYNIPQRPIMPFPTYQYPNRAGYPAAGPVYPTWGQTSNQQGSVHQMWGGTPSYPYYPTMENWLWKPYPAGGMYADAWGCPVMPPTPLPYPALTPVSQVQNETGLHSHDNKFRIPQNAADHYPGEEVVDKVVKEAISKPWLPLPIGLKGPSTESVLAELTRQGISGVPPPCRINGHRQPHC